MGTIGKVCLIITMLLLIAAVAPIPMPYGGWAPGLLVIHNNWSSKLYDGEVAVTKAQEANLLARQEYREKEADMEALRFGWDRTWNVASAAVGSAPWMARDQQGRLNLFPGRPDNDPNTVDNVVVLETNTQVNIGNAVDQARAIG